MLLKLELLAVHNMILYKRIEGRICVEEAYISGVLSVTASMTHVPRLQFVTQVLSLNLSMAHILFEEYHPQ